MSYFKRRDFILNASKTGAVLAGSALFGGCRARSSSLENSTVSSILPKTSDTTFAFTSNFPEFSKKSLRVISGALPAEMHGDYIKVGPAIQSRGNETIAHWFDGDPGLLRVSFAAGEANASFRHVLLPEAKREEAENKFIYATFGKKRGGILGNVINGKNIPNVTCYFTDGPEVIMYGDVGLPVIDTRENVHEELNLNYLKKNFTTSNAHHHMDLETGEVFGFGASMFPSGFNVFKLNAKHQLKQKTLVTTKNPIYAHDFALTKNFIVLFICPTRMHIIEGIAGVHSFSEAVRFEKNLATQVVVLSKNDLSVVSQFESDPFFFWHCGNAYERKNQNGSVEICFEAVTYEDFDSNTWLSSLPSGTIKSDTKGTLTRRVMDLNQKSVRLEGRFGNAMGSVEFPKVHTSLFGIESSKLAYVFRPEGDPEGGLWRGIATTSPTGVTDTYLHNEHTYYSEPEIIKSKGKEFLLSIALNTQDKKSEMHIFNETLSNGPICVFALDTAVSPGFHGSWRTM